MIKKGELTTTQIVTLIILLASFIVILIFLFLLDFEGDTEREVCHNSVVLKGKSEGLVGDLDCKTQYVCISSGGECEGFAADEKISVDAEDEDSVMNALAEEMANCWWMFGEGRVDYGKSGALSKNSCAVCSIVKFETDGNSIGYAEFYDWMGENKHNNEVYLKYLYNVYSAKELEDFAKDGNYLARNIDLSKEYLIVTGKSLDPFWDVFGIGDEDNIPVMILEKNKENYDLLNCENFVTF
jgi:hypothetical protein